MSILCRSLAKRSLIVLTHNERFHADDVMAYTMISTICKDIGFNIIENGITVIKSVYEEHILKRTRNPDEIENADIVFDVGSQFNIETNRFDHHQIEFTDTYLNRSIVPLSSSGLIYKYFKEYLIPLYFVRNVEIEYDDEHFFNGIYEGKKTDIPISYFNELSERDLNELYDMIYFHCFYEIDAIDNGISLCRNAENYIAKHSSAYSSLVNQYNTFDTEDSVAQMDAFLNASEYAQSVLDIQICYCIKKFFKLREDYEKIKEAMAARFEYNSNGKILVMDRENDCPFWRESIGKYEREFKIHNNQQITYIVYRCDKNWRVKTISDDRFHARRNLMSEKRLMKPDVLTNSDDIVFVHKGLFLVCTKTLETAIEVAQKSLE